MEYTVPYKNLLMVPMKHLLAYQEDGYAHLLEQKKCLSGFIGNVS
jgi:hypothetical protein